MPPSKPVEQFFDGVWLKGGDSGSNRDRQRKFPEHARDLKNSLLLLAQPLDLEFDHMPQTLRCFQIDFLQGYLEVPASVLGGNQTAVFHVLQDCHHEQGIASGVAMD